jgi:hypothetical protein
MKIGNLIDAEYDALEYLSKDELRDYLLDYGFGQKEVEKYIKEEALYIFGFKED